MDLEGAGRLIQARRSEMGLDQAGFTALIGDITQTTISRIERGMNRPSYDLAVKIEDTLGLAAGELLASWEYMTLGGSVPAAIAGDPKLSKGDRQVMLSLYRRFTSDCVIPTVI